MAAGGYAWANCKVAPPRSRARARNRRGLDASAVEEDVLVFSGGGGGGGGVEVWAAASIGRVFDGAGRFGVEDVVGDGGVGVGNSVSREAVTETKILDVTVEGGRVVVVVDKASQHSLSLPECSDMQDP